MARGVDGGAVERQQVCCQSSASLASQKGRRDPGHRREVRPQPGNRHRIDDGAAPVASRAIWFYPRTMAGPASRLWGAFIRWTLAAPMRADQTLTAFTSYGRKACNERSKRYEMPCGRRPEWPDSGDVAASRRCRARRPASAAISRLYPFERPGARTP